MSLRTTLGFADQELYEGSEESRRLAREASHRRTRLNLARGHATWVELDSDVIEPAAGRYVVDTTTGALYHPVKLLRVFPSGAAQIVNDAEADAFYVVDDELYFLRRPKLGRPTTVAELEERRSRPKPAPRRRRATT
jgi:hypothetical protein